MRALPSGLPGVGQGSRQDFACETWKRKFVSGNPSYVRDPRVHGWLERSKSLGALGPFRPPEEALRPRVSGFVGHVPGRRDVVGRQDLSLAISSPRAHTEWGRNKLPPVTEMQRPERLVGFAGHVPSLRSRVGFRGCDLPDLDNATRRGGPEAAALGYPTELGIKIHKANEEAIHGPSADCAVRHTLPAVRHLNTPAAPPQLALIRKGAGTGGGGVFRVMGAPETWGCMSRAPNVSDVATVESIFDPENFQNQVMSKRRSVLERNETQRRCAQGLFGARDDFSSSKMSELFKERKNLRRVMERQAHSDKDLTKMHPAGGKPQTTMIDLNYFVRGKKLEDMAGVLQPRNCAAF